MCKLSSAIVLLVSLTAFNAEANLLTDGDFESGTLGIHGTAVADQWLVEANGALVTGVTNGVTPFGSRMLEIGDAIGGSVAQAQQQVLGSFVAGTTVSFDVELNAFGTGVAGNIFVSGLSGLSVGLGTPFTSPNFTLDNDVSSWESFNINGLLGSDVSGLLVEIRVFNTTLEVGGRTGYADNAVLTATAPIPEPVSMILFGSGLIGLGAWRRFKKNA